MHTKDAYAVIIFVTPNDIASSMPGPSTYRRYVYKAVTSEFIQTHRSNEGIYNPIEVNFCLFLAEFAKASTVSKEKRKKLPAITVIVPIHDIEIVLTLKDIPTKVLFAFSQVDEKLKAIEKLNKEIITSITATQERLVSSAAPANDRLSTLYESRGYLYSTVMDMYRNCLGWFTGVVLRAIQQRQSLLEETNGE